MKNKDDLILEQLYQEGILDRIGGQFKGVKAGSGQLLQNLSRKIYQKAGGEAMPPASQTAGQSYAKAQQKSLLDSFLIPGLSLSLNLKCLILSVIGSYSSSL